MKQDQWAEHAKGLLKAELKKRNVSYRDLAERLTAMGIPESERNIANKISRGGFTAAFLLQCLRAIGCDDVRIDHMPSLNEPASAGERCARTVLRGLRRSNQLNSIG